MNVKRVQTKRCVANQYKAQGTNAHVKAKKYKSSRFRRDKRELKDTWFFRSKWIYERTLGG